MRILISILFLSFFYFSKADDFTVFEKDGYFGIKDQTGTVTVPAVYEKLGWSDGSEEVRNGVIGFKQNNLWGLINVRNKELTGQIFYTIKPSTTGYFEASIKGKFSNHLFHGVLDEKGRTIISFNYFTIEPLGANWLVSTFNGKRQSFGIVSFQNEILLPAKYQAVEQNSDFIIGKNHEYQLDIYSHLGVPIEYGLDSLIENRGWIAYRGGYAGFLTHFGQKIYDFEFKSFSISDNGPTPIEFPEWKIYKKDSLFLEWKCDSIKIGSGGLMTAFLNGAHHLIVKNEILLQNHQQILREIGDNHMVVQSSKTRKWSVLDFDGNKITSSYDSILSVKNLYLVLKENQWDILNSLGRKINRTPYEKLGTGKDGELIGNKNGYWGILNSAGCEATSFKYDDIKLGNGVYYVSYLNRWGAMNSSGDWIVRPEFAEICSYGDLIVGRRGRGYSYYNDGNLRYRTTDQVVSKLGNLFLVKNDSSRYGLFHGSGYPQVLTIYDQIDLAGEYFVLYKNGTIEMRDEEGRLVVELNKEYQAIGDFGEDYYLAKKQNRWGFVDKKGRLRISNRYDSAQIFRENRAPVMLRSKWGFINKNEDLKIQPYYEEVSLFENGVAIVMLDGKYGLIDKEGREVLELKWKSIRRLATGNYIVQNMNGQVGLVNEMGGFILRPAFDDLKDIGNRILVFKNSEWGMLDYSGKPIFKINHEEIKVFEDLTMIKN
ncbi:WG repeat-containing protein [Ekhidna sp.]|uniref:WG repeat-containing protein n=1 Tax=Ekhidna sp. TaxID=2608089 RepID=UPI003BABBCA3